jgi:hypothetical protein
VPSSERPNPSRTTGRVVLVAASLIAVVAAAPPATAQNPLANGGAQRSPGCLPRATRTRESCDPKQVVVRTEKEVAFPLELAPLNPVQCAVVIDIAYTQRGTAVGVEGTIANNVCGASSGAYKLVVSVRTETSGLQRLEFFESWQRQDDQPVKFSGTYEIGENVDVVRVRPVQLRCTCADADGPRVE